MATANELLDNVLAEYVDKTLIVDNELRTITIPDTIHCLGVEHDDDVHELNFRVPRYFCNTDLSEFIIRVNYVNAGAEKDYYEPDTWVTFDDFITFTWVVGPIATKYKGETSFNVCLRTMNDDGTIGQEFNTTLASLPVLEGLEVDEYLVEKYSDVVEQWRLSLIAVSDAEKVKLNELSLELQENITERGNEVLASIPEVARTKANAIISTVEGTRITVNDSSEDFIRGLKIYGKTEQRTTTGKQLLKINQAEQTIDGITFTPDDEGYIHVSGTATATARYMFDDQATTPMIGVDLIASIHSNNSQDISMGVYYYRENPAYGYVLITSSNPNAPMTFSYPDTAAKSCTMLVVNEGVTIDTWVQPMIRLASIEDDTFEPYTGGIPSPSPEYPAEFDDAENFRVTIADTANPSTINNTLSISDSVRSFDESVDHIDFNNGVMVRNVGEDRVYESIDYMGFNMLGNVVFKFDLNGVKRDIVELVSNRFKFAGFHSVAELKLDELVSGEFVGVQTGTRINCYFALPTSIAASEMDVRNWLNNNEIVVRYIKETPTEEPLPEDVITEYRAAHTYKPSTTVYNGYNLKMELSYNADTEIWLENKINELIGDVSAALDELNGEVI